MRDLKRFLLRPMTYGIWLAFVTAALASAYLADPYIFGFATLILGTLSLFFFAAGLAVLAGLGRPPLATKKGIGLSLVLLAAVLMGALGILKRFSWS